MPVSVGLNLFASLRTYPFLDGGKEWEHRWMARPIRILQDLDEGSFRISRGGSVKVLFQGSA